jgi:hypothetical protein
MLTRARTLACPTLTRSWSRQTLQVLSRTRLETREFIAISVHFHLEEFQAAITKLSLKSFLMLSRNTRPQINARNTILFSIFDASTVAQDPPLSFADPIVLLVRQNFLGGLFRLVCISCTDSRRPVAVGHANETDIFIQSPDEPVHSVANTDTGIVVGVMCPHKFASVRLGK